MTTRLKSVAAISVLALLLAGCGANPSFATLDYCELTARAKQEGTVEGLGMPDTWANWGATWKDLKTFYGIENTGTDMKSGPMLEKFALGEGDIGDIGFQYAKKAKDEKLVAGYKTSYWDDIPGWAKDDQGDYIVSFTGTMALLTNKNLVSDQVTKFSDLLNGTFKVGISDASKGTTGQFAVYAAALALGGSSDNIEPGISLLQQLAQAGRLVNASSYSKLISENIGVMIGWDFSVLAMRDSGLAESTPVVLSPCIPSDGSVTTGYATIINRQAKHPYAACLVREYILSDAGQLNVAEGYATPIRSIKLPTELESKRIPRSQYNQTQIDEGEKFSDSLTEKIISEWQEKIAPNIITPAS